MRIIVDFDAVIVDLVEVWQRWHEAHCPLRSAKLHFAYESCCDIRQTPVYEVEKWALCGNTIYGFFNRNPYTEAQPIAGATLGIVQLTLQGHDVWIASSIPSGHPEHYGHKLGWIESYLGESWLPRFVAVGGDKSGVLGDILVDDAAHVIEAWPGPHKILVDRPWNQRVDIWAAYRPSRSYRSYHRARDWDEILASVEVISETGHPIL